MAIRSSILDTYKGMYISTILLNIENESYSLPESSGLLTLSCIPESGRNNYWKPFPLPHHPDLLISHLMFFFFKN